MKMIHFFSKHLVTMVLAGVFVSSGYTQQKNLLETGGASRYYIGEKDQLLIPVNILGFVNKPGQYLLPNETDLISLIAYAGGFREDAKLSRVKIVRTATPGATPQLIEVNVKEFLEAGKAAKMPKLMPDDTILVSGKSSRFFNSLLNTLTRLSVLAQIAFYIVYFGDR